MSSNSKWPVLTGLVLGSLCVVSLVAGAAAKERPKGVNLLSVRVAPFIINPIDCRSDCTVEVWVYAPRDATEPDGPHDTCAAVIQRSPIVVPKGTSGQKINWKLVRKTTGDTTAYAFDSPGIDIEIWTKKRYRSVRNKDFKKPTAIGTDTFQWEVVNARQRDYVNCHDPDVTDEDPGTVGNKKCEIAYVARVMNAQGDLCGSYDPLIINNGQ